MTLVTLFFAWLPVALLFAGWAWLAMGRRLERRLAAALLGEAALLTLLAALWFGSLGHGGWWLVFLLLGLLVSGAERMARLAVSGAPLGTEWRPVVLGAVRYIAAGALLAWRLG